jgi:methylenetetrahydrofolate dehydrogenase (NADP+)/methenyltetrahydrofolate cyclohydrolase
MQILDGKKVAETVAEELRERIAALRKQNIEPTLAIIVVGDDLRTQRYIAAKQRAAEQLGIQTILIPIAPTTPEETRSIIEKSIAALNEKPEIHGIILQLPIPVKVDEQELIDLIAPTKDVDGLTLTNQAALELGRELFLPATPQGILRLLSAYKVPIADQRIAVVGQGKLVGKPVTAMLQSRDADVVTANSQTKSLTDTLRGANIVISAVGKENLITEEMVDDKMVLIDVGLSDVDGKLRGDIALAAKEKALLATPVPGGVGPMTVISLLANVVLAAELAQLRLETNV